MAHTVKQCCCGCSLKTGTLLIAFLYLVSNFGHLIYCVVRAKYVQLTPDEAKSVGFNAEQRELFNKILAISFYMYIIAAILAALQLLLSLALIYGAVKEVPKVLKPWVVWNIVVLCLNVIFGFCVMIFAFIYGGFVSGLIVIGAMALVIVLMTYFIIVVHSFYLQLQETQQSNKV